MLSSPVTPHVTLVLPVPYYLEDYYRQGRGDEVRLLTLSSLPGPLLFFSLTLSTRNDNDNDGDSDSE